MTVTTRSPAAIDGALGGAALDGAALDGAAPDRQAIEGMRRRELAAFLRTRRERITPEQVGLPSIGRRRTPGLRREEVAQLAGVGVTWYTWLEQGRDINASPEVLEAIARTLQLDRNERTHLLTLAGAPLEAVSGDDCYAVSDATRSLLDKLEPYPAVVVNSRYDLLAYNRTYGSLLIDLDSLPPEDRNALWLLATHPAYRVGLGEWEASLARVVATFRASYADHVGEPAWKSLVKRLIAASPEFREQWERHEVAVPQRGFKSIVNARVGLLRFEYTNMWLCQRRNVRLMTYIPEDSETLERLELLRSGELVAS
jgi:transcriptional regulator with XRE-family HTH domain